jgi:hypothetical protein
VTELDESALVRVGSADNSRIRQPGNAISIATN